MKQSIMIPLIVTVLMGYIIACSETEPLAEDTLPLAGSYTLVGLTINVEATTLRDTTVTFLTPQGGDSIATISAGTLILITSTNYTDQDSTPIGGTVELANDGSAQLNGFLPANYGSGCQPYVIIANLASDGTWLADTSQGVFSLDLVIDQLDIVGTFSRDGNQLEVRYSAVEDHDERMIEVVNYQSATTGIVPMCIPVATTTERVMTLALDTN